MKNPRKTREDEKRINILFSEWLRKRESEVDNWDPKPGTGQSVFYRGILQPVFGPQCEASSDATEPDELVKLIDRTVEMAHCHRETLRLPGLGKGIQSVLGKPLGTTEWAETLDCVSKGSKDGVAELLLTAKLLFQVRNFL